MRSLLQYFCVARTNTDGGHKHWIGYFFKNRCAHELKIAIPFFEFFGEAQNFGGCYVAFSMPMVQMRGKIVPEYAMVAISSAAISLAHLKCIAQVAVAAQLI